MTGSTTGESRLDEDHPAVRPAQPDRTDRLRGLILLVLCFGMIGTLAELILLEHTEDTWQWIPLILLCAGLLTALPLAVRSRRLTVRCFQIVMVLFIAAGLAGLYLHYSGNVEFELEMYPTMEGFELIWQALSGATPALAPGAMALFGMIGLTLTYGHTATRTGRHRISSEEDS